MNAGGKGRLRWNASGTQLSQWIGMSATGDGSISFFLPHPFILPSHDQPPQDSDYPTRMPQKFFDRINPYRGAAIASSGMLGSEIAVGGTLLLETGLR